MTATTPESAPGHGIQTPLFGKDAAPRTYRRAGFADVVRSEITKGLSVRSTYWTLMSTVVVTVGLGALIAFGNMASWDDMPVEAKAQFNPVVYSLSGIYFGQIAIAVLGVIVITSEYGTGLIRTSLAAVPRRPRLLAAKALVFGAAAVGVGVVTSFAAFFICQAIFATKNLDAQLGDPNALRAVIGAGLFLAMTGLFALAIGAILRHTAGSVTTVLGFMLLPTMLGPLLPQWWQEHLVRYLPFNAGGQVAATTFPPESLGAWTGFGVFCLWTAVLLALAFILLQRRDA